MTKYTINTYIVNLKHDAQNWNNCIQSFSKHNIYPIRYDAIYGKDPISVNKFSHKLTNFSKYFSVDSVIGCGLSHLDLLQRIYQTDHNDYALVCEDDILIKENIQDINLELQFIINNSPSKWDIISLYCQGFCKYNNNNMFNKSSKLLTGSTACYLVNIKNLHKIINMKLNTHIDIQLHSSPKLNVYIYNKQLFTTNDSQSSTTSLNTIPLYSNIHFNNLHNSSIDTLLDYNHYKIFNTNINTKHILFLITFCLIFYCCVYKKYKSIPLIILTIYILPILCFTCVNFIYT